MADGLTLTQGVEVRRDCGGGDVEVLVKEIERRRQRCTVLGAVGAFDHREQLDTIAGGEDEGLADAGLVREGARSVGKPCDGYGEALAHVEWSCRVRSE